MEWPPHLSHVTPLGWLKICLLSAILTSSDGTTRRHALRKIMTVDKAVVLRSPPDVCKPPCNSLDATGAILQLTRCAALDAAGAGVRINAVCPGPIMTPRTQAHAESQGKTLEDTVAEMTQQLIIKRCAVSADRRITINVIIPSKAQGDREKPELASGRARTLQPQLIGFLCLDSVAHSGPTP